MLDGFPSEDKKQKSENDSLEKELFGEDGKSGLWFIWPSSRRESKKAVRVAYKAARKRTDYETIMSAAKVYAPSLYVTSRIEMKEFSTIKSLPVWLNEDLWERDPVSFQEPCHSWKIKHGLNGSVETQVLEPPAEYKKRSRITYHRKLVDEQRAKGVNDVDILQMLNRCGLKPDEVSQVMAVDNFQGENSENKRIIDAVNSG